MKGMLMSIALCAGAAVALSESAKQQHIEQVFSAASITKTTCSASLATSTTTQSSCGEYRFGSDLLARGWTLYADWDSKVTNTARQVKPWTRSDTGNTLSATFEFKDGERYIVTMSTGTTNTQVFAGYLRSSTTSSATPSSSPMSSTSKTLTPTFVTVAGARRVATIVPSVLTTLENSGFNGNIQSYIVRRFKYTSAFGGRQEEIQNTTTRTFDKQGRLIEVIEQDNIKGTTKTTRYTFDSDKLVQRNIDEGIKKTSISYFYDEQQNFIRSETVENNVLASVERIAFRPDGYISTVYQKDNSIKSISVVYMNVQGRELRRDFFSPTSSEPITTTIEFDAQGRPIRGTITSSLVVGTSEYNNGLMTTFKSAFKGSLASQSPSSQRVQHLDKDISGNARRAVTETETSSFGATTWESTQLETYDYKYF